MSSNKKGESGEKGETWRGGGQINSLGKGIKITPLPPTLNVKSILYYSYCTPVNVDLRARDMLYPILYFVSRYC